MSWAIHYRALIRYNIILYKGVPPPVSLINKLLVETGLSRERFEIVYGIPMKTLMRYCNGTRGLPPAHWHIIYEFYNLDKFYATFNAAFKKQITPRSVKKEKKQQVIIADINKNLIDAYRAAINQRGG